MSTYLQGRFVVPVSYKVRLIEGIEGGHITVDVSFAAGETFASVDAILKKFNDELTDSVFAVDTSTGKIVWTPGGSLTAIVHIFDQDSSGATTRRDFLGAAAAITFADPHSAGWYPSRQLTRLDFSRISVPRASRMLMDKTAESQWGPDSESGHSLLDVELFSSSLNENASLEDFFDEVYTGHGEPFSITNGTTTYSVMSEDTPFSLQFNRVSERLDTYWKIDLQLWSV